MAAEEPDSCEGLCERHRHRAAPLTSYFDTSAVVKLLLDEPGASTAGKAWDDATGRASSVALLAESRAALARARRDARLSADGYRQAVGELVELWQEMNGVELTEGLAIRTGELADLFALRGYDAVHLASAEAIAEEDTVLVTADHDLASAAASLGLLAVVLAG